MSLAGNDLYRRRPRRMDQWSRMDGRRFAVQASLEERAFDLVLSNPPFGTARRWRGCAGLDELPLRVRKLVENPRIDVGMTAACAMLVAEGGMLGAILPNTVHRGDTFRELREWLASEFTAFRVDSIPRGDFRNCDLGLVLLLATKEPRDVGADGWMRPEHFTAARPGLGRRAFQRSERPPDIRRVGL